MKPEDFFKAKLPILRENPTHRRPSASTQGRALWPWSTVFFRKRPKLPLQPMRAPSRSLRTQACCAQRAAGMALFWSRRAIRDAEGAVPGGGSQLKVAMYPGGGGPSFTCYFEEMREKGLITSENSSDQFISTVIDAKFRLPDWRRHRHACRGKTKRGTARQRQPRSCMPEPARSRGPWSTTWPRRSSTSSRNSSRN